MSHQEPTHPQTERPYWAGATGRCPHCGEGHLFDGFLKLAPRCDVCGLDFSFADTADGPAFFSITFACLPSVFFGVWLEVVHQAPYWVHAVTTIPLMFATLIPPLRPLKGLLVASQYINDAHEGRLVVPEDDVAVKV